MSLKYELIKLLSDGKFHSGEALGQQLNVTRSAVWSMIQQLNDLGIEVYSVKGKGYQIPQGIEFLDIPQIKSFLPASVLQQINIELLNEVDSTNQYLLDNLNQKNKGTIIFSEHQTAGRGRRQRPWASPFGMNIYFSILWSFEKDPSALSGLSLAAGVAVANTLERFNIHHVKLKWPNDILWNNKKISGILIEMTAETYSNTQTVIGIGVNVSMPTNIKIDQQWTDIAAIIGKKPKRNLFAAYLIEEIIEMLEIFQQKGMSGFVKYWQALDAYYDKPVMLSTPSQQFFGIAKGINSKGEFILLNQEKKEMRFLQGEISLKCLEDY